jgi:hypothetical protein
MRWLRWEMMGTELYRWGIEDDRLYRVHCSVNEAALMERNKRIRAEGSRKMEWARPVFSSSKAQRAVLEKQFPALASQDHAERDRAWQRLSRDPDYRDLFIGKV